MYVVDGIAYAGEQTPAIKVCGVRPMEDHRLWVRFNTGEAKVFDFSSLLQEPAFSPLSDPQIFAGVYIDYGVPMWLEGEVDIAPQYLYDHGESADKSA